MKAGKGSACICYTAGAASNDNNNITNHSGTNNNKSASQQGLGTAAGAQ